jgi:hypothetical protein
VGQEGLDFHTYCHAVVHWNLPSNPVDLEQREGRVHRYKGHAVRRNVAMRHCDAAFASEGTDPWVAMFREARKTPCGDDSDLVPYWVYPVENGAKIERHVPALPLSRDAAAYHRLRCALTLYRMAFGQSRQEDLIAFIQRNVPQEAQVQVARDLTINLAPPRSKQRLESSVDDTDLSATELADGIKEGRLEGRQQASISAETIRTLLDRFLACREKPSYEAGEPQLAGGPRHRSREEMSNLLDRFAAARPKKSCSKRNAQPLKELLDQYCHLVVERV